MMTQSVLRNANQRLRALNAELRKDLAFLGGSRTKKDGLRIDMPKYHAAHRCEAHRQVPYTAQDLDCCMVCLQEQIKP